MCMCIPPSKTQLDTNPTQDTIYTLAWVLVNLLATCDLSQGEGSRKEIKLPLGGVLGSAQSLQAAAFRPEHGLVSEAARVYLQRQEWENYGQIHAKGERRHQNPSNDGLEFFEDNTPEHNPIVHQKHIFIKIIVISRFFKSKNSYA